MSNPIWADATSALARFVLDHNQSCLNAYRAQAGLVKEHCGQEREVSQGGYSQRQFYELIQNGADELQHRSDGRIEVVLTDQTLYCANEGHPLTVEGAETILMAYMSAKRGTQIGRFGLGFKAVLNVCNAPEFYSHSGSFRFSDAYSLQQVRGVVPDAAIAPILRLADPIDPYAEAAADPILRSLMEWATSVIKLPLVRGLDWLARDIASFPAEFLLFSPHVARLTLTDRRTQSSIGQRHISARLVERNSDFSQVVIEESRTDGEPRFGEWKIFSAICDLTQPKYEAARQDGGVINQRDQIPISWAVPLTPRNERSKFWAFFPTEEFITLSGILNAPWKTNSDRQNVLSGPFNDALLDVTTQIIADALPHLQSDDDPARYLEVLPALNDNPCWGDLKLRDLVYPALARRPSLLNADGVLCLPATLKFHPRLPREALAIWHAYPNRPADWIHPSNELPIRRARLEQLMKLAQRYPHSVEAWLEALVADRSALASAHALRAAAALLGREPSQRRAVESARILLTQSGQWIAPQPGTVFVASPGQNAQGVQLVADAVLEQDGVAQALESLGIRSADASARLESMLQELTVIQADTSPYRASRLTLFGWNDLWLATRGVPLERALHLLESAIQFPEDVLHAKNLAGNWIALHQLLLPGALFSPDSGENSALIDLDWHGLDEAILKHFGATDAPRANYKYGHGNFYCKRLLERYWQAASKALLKESGRRPQERSLTFERILPTTGPLDAFSRLTDAGQARFCQHLTQTVFDDAPWVYVHGTQPDGYPKIACDAPSVYLLRTMGVLPTSRGPQPVAHCLAPALARWKTWLPVAEVAPEIAEKLNLRAEFGALSRAELQGLGELLGSVNNGRLLGEFYAACARAGMKAATVRCQRGDEWIEEDCAKVVAAGDAKTAAILKTLNAPFLDASPADAATLIERWKLVVPNFVREVSFEASSDETELLDHFPALWAIASEEFMGLMLQPCSQLGERVSLHGGVRVLPQVFLREENTMFHRDDLPRDQLLRHIFDALETPVDAQTRAELEIAARQTTTKRARSNWRYACGASNLCRKSCCCAWAKKRSGAVCPPVWWARPPKRKAKNPTKPSCRTGPGGLRRRGAARVSHRFGDQRSAPAGAVGGHPRRAPVRGRFGVSGDFRGVRGRASPARRRSRRPAAIAARAPVSERDDEFDSRLTNARRQARVVGVADRRRQNSRGGRGFD